MHFDFEYPGGLSIANFDYDLPKDKIALYPLSQRDQSKLLVYHDENITEAKYNLIADYLKEGSLMVFNESKVVQARLLFQQENGSPIEIFCLEPSDSNSEINQAMQSKELVSWRCLVGDLRKWKGGPLRMMVSIEGHIIEFKAELVGKEGSSCIIQFSWDSKQITFAEILLAAGKVPLPPYIKRDAEISDKERYQTIFAKHEGSVAAPTAGLHFTKEIFDSLEAKRIKRDYVTLHVGAGTFKPVKAERLSDHEMHSEQIVVERRLLENLLTSDGKDIIAVGTTSLRTLESIYWLGLKVFLKEWEKDQSFVVRQWDPYELDAKLSMQSSILELLNFLEKENLERLITRTSIIIAPGYPWKVVNALITNFHQPKSTLMLLVAAFVGEKWRNVYHYALNNDFRFLSYGDGSLLFRPTLK